MKHIVIQGTVLAVLLAGFLIPGVAYALPAGFEMKTVVDGLNLPTTIAFAPDGRIFVAEKSGAVRIVKDGVLLETPFVQLQDVNDYGDHGLIGLALDPDFANNRWVYLSYTYENDPTNYEGPKTGRVMRVQAVGDVADTSTFEVLVGTIGGTPEAPSCQDYPAGSDCIPSDESSHSVGGLRFGPDGMLYATLGDGSSFEKVDPLAERAQDVDSLAGKMLRINTDGTAPADNPFYNGDPTANRSRVWNYGLRNAFRFNFHPETGIPYLGDVGWFTAEEVNAGTAGANFGWPCREGYDAAPGYTCEAVGYVDPWYAYDHDPDTGAGSVTAGVFLQGAAYPAEYIGDYIFGDFAINFLKRIRVAKDGSIEGVEDFMTDPGGPVEIVLGPENTIYYLSIYTGELRRITHTEGNRDPIATTSANPTSGLLPLTVQFFGDSSSDPDGDALSYHWDFGDGTTSTETNPLHTYTIEDTYIVTLTVDDGKGGVDSDTLSIVAGNEAPQARIISPANGSTYQAHEQVFLTGEGIDPEDGVLPDSSLHWRIILHHNTHIHIIQQLEGSAVSFLGPDHNATDVFIEVELTVTDSVGLQDTTSINLYLEDAVPAGEFQSEFYNNTTATGDPILLRLDPAVNFNWGHESPDPAVPADQFSARFTGDFDFGAGEYTFSAWADDGIRLFVDGNLVFDGWVDQAATLYQGVVNLAEGTHRVQLEYYDNLYNAVVELSWEQTGEFVDPGPPDPHHEGTVVVPTHLAPGELVTITSTVHNHGGEGPILVDIEVYKDDVKVAQEFYDNVVISPDALQDFQLLWAPEEIGEYRVAVGLIESGWGSLYSWTNDAAFFSVIDTVLPTPEPVWIYDDNLYAGWVNWSWDATVDFASADTTYEESSVSTKVEYTGGWGGFFLHHDGIDTSGQTHVAFAVSGGGISGQELQIRALDSTTEVLAPQPLANYLAHVPADSWAFVEIPLTDLGVQPGDTITGFIFQDISGVVGSTVYFDSMFLFSVE